MGRRARKRVLGGSENVSVFVDGCCQTVDFNDLCQPSHNSEVYLNKTESSDCLNTLISFIKQRSTSENSFFTEAINSSLNSYCSTNTNVTDLFIKILENLEKQYKDIISERDRVIEDYDENLMISKTELVESKKNLQDILNKFYACKAETSSLHKLLKNYQFNSDSKIASLELEKLKLNQCILDQKTLLEEMSNSFQNMMKELENIKEAKRFLEIENRDLVEKNEIVYAHIFCEADSSQDSRRSADEIIENMCALQTEKHELERKNSCNEKTINYLRKQLNDKIFTENHLKEQFADSLKLVDTYKDKLKVQENQFSELLQHLESSKNDISSLNKERLMNSKFCKELQQEKDSVTKEINYCLTNLKQLNGNLEDASQGLDPDKLTPFMVALQIEFTNPLMQCLVNEMKTLFLHMKTFVNFFNGLMENFEKKIHEKRLTMSNLNDERFCSNEAHRITSSSDNNNLKQNSHVKARNMNSSNICENNLCQDFSKMQNQGRSSYCKFTVYKNTSSQSDNINDLDDKFCRVQ